MRLRLIIIFNHIMPYVHIIPYNHTIRTHLNFPVHIIHIILLHTHFTNNYKLLFYHATVLLDACTITTSSLGANLSYKVGDPAYSLSLVFKLLSCYSCLSSCCWIFALPWEVHCCFSCFACALTVLCLFDIFLIIITILITPLAKLYTGAPCDHHECPRILIK